MKKTIIANFILLLSLGLKAQMTLENVYNTPNSTGLHLYNLTNSGYKYCYYNMTSRQLKLYNTNHSIFNSITIPNTTGTYTIMAVTSDLPITDNLFNSDNLLEFTVRLDDGSGNPVIYGVINENGSLIGGITPGISYPDFKIINISGLYKLKIQHDDSCYIYSLPGSMPCDACGGPTGIIKNSNSNSTPNAFPNPTSDQINIPYTFPNNEKTGKVIIYDINGKMIKEFKVDNTFDNLILDTQEFSAGTYYYNLTTNSGVSNAKKIIVIK